MGPDDAELHVGEVSAAADHGRGPQRRREGRPRVLARGRHGLFQVDQRSSTVVSAAAAAVMSTRSNLLE